jgi:hydrogenase maturation protein HypF
VTIKAYELKIEGLVQGVGFRPFVYGIARREQIAGWVRNSTSGVNIHIQATEDQLNKFIQALKSEAPLACEIHQLLIEEKLLENLTDFKILPSKDNESEITQVSPDIAVCKQCLEDMINQPHRINYPFTNCTHCGPRFSIVRELPYDRERTTMNVFPMCTHCRTEYSDIEDRRFHAQPVACNECGPNYSLELKEGNITKLDELLDKLAELIQIGGIIAIKGMGGFFLMCDALNEMAVSRLRKSKIREGKPFAVLFRNIEAVKKNALVSAVEAEFLESWQRPIVILEGKRHLAPSVSMGFPTIGVILPYMPLHYLIFERILADALVLTSGNLSDEPIIVDNHNATAILGNISDAVLYYNRDIHNRVDDSVGFVVNGKPRLIRRSRGYVPSPVFLNRLTEGILATGAELNNCFCIGKGNQAILSQHIGDLKNFETYQFYTESIERFSKLFRVKVSCAAYDLHPDYLSASYAKDLDVAGYAIQHHHAHIAACMTENVVDEPVIGVAMDGTGYGTDGTIWGSEFMIANLLNFERITHFPYIPLPGGDSVTKEPWRTGMSVLHSIYGNELSGLDLPFLKIMGDKRKDLIIEALEKNINCPPSCSAGRWFDAVAAITGICTVAGFHSEAPMRLEACIDKFETGDYPWELLQNGEIELTQLIKAIVKDIHTKVPVSKISARFHNTIARIITEMIYSISLKSGIKKAVFSGGSFQNKFLLTKLEREFQNSEIKIFTQSRIPSNDAGIALGQLAIAAKQREAGW